MKKTLLSVCAAAVAIFSGCTSDEPKGGVDGTGHALVVVCEGNYMSANGEISVYNPENGEVENDVFSRVNGMKLGSIAQSATLFGDKIWIVVNGSGVVFAVDKDTYQERGRIVNLTEPRNIAFINEKKAYITQLNSNKIVIVDPSTYSITGYIETPLPSVDTGYGISQGSTEEMIKIGDYVYVNCWSYQKEVLKIDTRTDKVVDRMVVGLQPKAMAYDGHNTIYVLCDGGSWQGNPIGFEAPSIVAIDVALFKATKQVNLPDGGYVSELCFDDGYLYWLDAGVKRMSVKDFTAPQDTYIELPGASPYCLTVSPTDGNIYIGDAVDYSQNGVVYRYCCKGNELDKFTVGVCPGAFCWK